MPPRLFCPEPLAAGQVVALPSQAAHHAGRVLRLAIGDDVVLFDGRGGEHAGRITALGREVRVVLVRHDAVEREAPLRDHPGPGAGGRREDGLAGAEGGRARRRARSRRWRRSAAVVRLTGERAAKRVEHLRQVAVAACEQCGRNRVPPVAELARLPDFLAAQASSAAVRLTFDPAAGQRAEQPGPCRREVLLLIGPEGGLSGYEAAAAQAADSCRWL
ncbi:MAG: RsmE family RNA methyltransferase [Comamonadaceae bacterium]|nr:RsmE family RNA methyltransferase [Comamonadaceae bacterium]